MPGLQKKNDPQIPEFKMDNRDETFVDLPNFLYTRTQSITQSRLSVHTRELKGRNPF